MKKLKRWLSFLITAVMMIASSSISFAADSLFNDVSVEAWYANAVDYVQNNGIMSGTSANAFSPNSPMTRAMLTAVLYRAAGSPSANNKNGFSDVDSNAYYADAVNWASENSIVNGYDSNTFGVNDSVSREQIAAILYRYAGSPAVAGENNFSDKNSISSYAVSAVNWAEQNGIINGTDGNRFDPQGNATRAQVALILYNYLNMNKENTSKPDTDKTGKALVVYYSASGNTERVAKEIASAVNADLFEITPVTPYTSEDLDWTEDGSRVNREHDNEALRNVPLTTTKVANWDDYDTVFIGYPIWWGIAAWPVNNFVKNNNFTGKTVIPFATSSSSGMGQSGQLLEEMTGTGNWQEGQRFSGRVSESTVSDWVSSLEISD